MTAVDSMILLDELASEQWGLVTAAQAKERGVSLQVLARLAEHGRLERLTHGVYRVAGAPPHPLEGIRSAWLALDPATLAGQRARQDVVGVVSHRSAAQVHQVGDLDTDRVEFTTRRRRQTRRHDVRIHVLPLGRDDWELVDGLPVTTLARTIGDLAKASLDGGHLAGVVRDAVVDHHVDIAVLEAALAPFAHRYGVGRDHGDELVARFLQEAGIPDTTKRAVAVAERGRGMALDPQLAEQWSKLAGLEDFSKAFRAAYPKISSDQLAGLETFRKAVEAASPKVSSDQLSGLTTLTAAFAEAVRPLQQQAFRDLKAALTSDQGRQMVAQVMSEQLPALEASRTAIEGRARPPAATSRADGPDDDREDAHGDGVEEEEGQKRHEDEDEDGDHGEEH